MKNKKKYYIKHVILDTPETGLTLYEVHDPRFPIDVMMRVDGDREYHLSLTQKELELITRAIFHVQRDVIDELLWNNR